MKRLLVLFTLALSVPVVALAAESAAPSDPLVPLQWYLTQDRAFEAQTDAPLRPVRVAVIDSGIDAAHPEFQGRIVAARSFVPSSARLDRKGHGTFVAGEIAAAWNGQGIAGIALPARLLIAKVIGVDSTIRIRAEARAIRWAVAKRARVINLSLSGPRDPRQRSGDSYSRIEADAIAYAVRHNVVVVAAVGNSNDVPNSSGIWNYAGYPAALPHVLGVSAFSRDGDVPAFSNRDARFNDLAAPGTEIVSTFPRPLTARFPSCADQGYSVCGSTLYRRGAGTSFAAPQATAAAALLISAHPQLRAEQVTALLERTAVDLTPVNGCESCRLGRDSLSGWGRLDIAAALAQAGSAPGPRDRFEPNERRDLGAPYLYGDGANTATLDYWDDPIDVYRVRRSPGERLAAGLTLRSPGLSARLVLRNRNGRVFASAKAGPTRSLVVLDYPVRQAGWYFVEVKALAAGRGAYGLSLRRHAIAR